MHSGFFGVDNGVNAVDRRPSTRRNAARAAGRVAIPAESDPRQLCQRAYGVGGMTVATGFPLNRARRPMVITTRFGGALVIDLGGLATTAETSPPISPLDTRRSDQRRRSVAPGDPPETCGLGRPRRVVIVVATPPHRSPRLVVIAHRRSTAPRLAFV